MLGEECDCWKLGGERKRSKRVDGLHSKGLEGTGSTEEDGMGRVK